MTSTDTAARILISTLGQGRATIEDAETAQQHRDAIAAGTVRRESETPGDEPYFVRVVEYVDPVDGVTRYAVHQADPNEEEITDYADRTAAEGQYEQDVRDSAEANMPYRHTDVELDTDDEVTNMVKE